jgi:hypothetical protein
VRKKVSRGHKSEVKTAILHVLIFRQQTGSHFSGPHAAYNGGQCSKGREATRDLPLLSTGFINRQNCYRQHQFISTFFPENIAGASAPGTNTFSDESTSGKSVRWTAAAWSHGRLLFISYAHHNSSSFFFPFSCYYFEKPYDWPNTCMVHTICVSVFTTTLGSKHCCPRKMFGE